MSEIATIQQAARALREGRTTASDLIDVAFARIRLCEPRINALASHDEAGARDQAEQLDRELASGRDRGPLHGIPVAVKDNIATRDLPTELGSPIARGTRHAEDAAVVRRLKEAGAIVIAKNNLHEFALGATNINRHTGDVANPWDVQRTPGGSSGGSAAAVAAGEVFASIGSDSGGSVRVPAAMCGVVGLKPTHGRVSLRGVIGAAWSLDHLGPLTRSVADAALVYAAVAGYDAADAESVDRPVDPIEAGLRRGAEGLRIGLIADRSMGALHPDVQAAVAAVGDALAGRGAAVHATTIRGVEDAPFACVAIAYPEVSAQHQDWIRTRRAEYGEDIRPLIDLGEIFSARQYLIAQRSRRYFRRRIDEALAGCDVLAMPTAAVTASRRDGQSEPLEGDDPKALFTLMRYTAVFNVTGLPAISVPCGLDHRGLPIGVQFVARPFQENALFGVAAAYEATRSWSFPAMDARLA